MTTPDWINLLTLALTIGDVRATEAAIAALEQRLPAAELADLIEAILAATEPPPPVRVAAA